MFSPTLGVLASLALVANSILIPPNVAAEGLGDDNAMETLAINPFKRTVALECPGCALAVKEGDVLSWTEGAGTAFLLDFEVGPEESTLEIDGVELYPPAFGRSPKPLYVTQVDPDKPSEEALRLQVTGLTFNYNSAETVTEAGTELLPMTLRITSIEYMPVDPPIITINLLKDANGRLMIASFGQADAAPIDEEQECKEWPLLCKWKQMLADRLNGIKGAMSKGCHKNKGNPMESPQMHGKPPHTFRPGHPHHHPHHPHHHEHAGHRHHAHHKLHMFLRRVIFTILIPILIGIFAGTLTYLVGMALGCAIAILVAKVRGRAPYESISQDEDLEDASPKSSEKEVYAELPEYEAPPVYEEAAEKEVVDEAH